ncbi:MAG: type II secretion system protein [Planctomycetota bacterium]
MPKRAGFSLFELVIVIFVIGILMAVAMPRYLSHVAQTNDQMTLLKLMQVRDAIDRYQTEHDRQLPQITTEAGFKAAIEPYLRDGFPTIDIGPAKDLSTIEIVSNSGSTPSVDSAPAMISVSTELSAAPSTDAELATPDTGSVQAAWSYNKDTGEFRANYSAATALDPTTTYDQW